MLWTNNRNLIEDISRDVGYSHRLLTLGKRASRVLILTALLLCLNPSVRGRETPKSLQQGLNMSNFASIHKQWIPLNRSYPAIRQM